MNITNIKKEITNFMKNMNIDVVDISYVPGVVEMCYDIYSGENIEEKTDDEIKIVIGNKIDLDDEQIKKLSEFETYIYFSYHGLVMNYELKQ